jgi:hypothetical protein
MAEQNIVRKRFAETIFAVLEETFERVHGIYLDKGTSLFETLEGISAEEASRPLGQRSGSIAAKVDHACFYLGALEGYMLERPMGKIDWDATWRRQSVTAEEWRDLKGQLRDAYQRVLVTMRGFESWEGEEEIGGAVAIAIHTAYHLGEIRQALCVVQP